MIDPVTEEEGCEDGSLMMTCMPSRNEVHSADYHW